jgi:hypothetical protein
MVYRRRRRPSARNPVQIDSESDTETLGFSLSDGAPALRILLGTAPDPSVHLLFSDAVSLPRRQQSARENRIGRGGVRPPTSRIP